MARYAAFRTSTGFGPEVDEPAGEPPMPGAVLDGSFSAYGDPEDRHHRWVVDVPDLAALAGLVSPKGPELVFNPTTSGRYYDCYDLLEGGLDGILEVYDGWRE